MARSRSGTRGRRGPRKPQRRPETVAVQVAEPVERGAVELPGALTVKELSELLTVNPADVIRELIRNGIFANINQPVDRDTASLVATELGFEVAEPVRPAEEADGEAAVDPSGKASGRGAYLCADPACWSKALKNRAVQRALDVPSSEALSTLLASGPSTERIAPGVSHGA